jgi:cytochrome c biogenesis protein CcmG/thiol:disulfide interchange protein DsbE
MKLRIFPIFIFFIFFIIFFIFYKSLQNSNIYVPNGKIKKDIPIFQAKLFATENVINSEKIFSEDKYYLMNIWASWCVPCRDEHAYL